MPKQNCLILNNDDSQVRLENGYYQDLPEQQCVPARSVSNVKSFHAPTNTIHQVKHIRILSQASHGSLQSFYTPDSCQLIDKALSTEHTLQASANTPKLFSFMRISLLIIL